MANELDPPAQVPAPVDESRRLTAVDAARGFALVGIFLVNIRYFSEPFPLLTDPSPREHDTLALVCHYGVKGLCEGKFYVLFSLLFGIGLVLQMQNVRGRGGSFFGIYVVRLAALAGFGVIHALLLWYGDILFIYAIAGTLLMVLAWFCSGRVLLAIGLGMFLLGAAIAMGFATLGALARQPTDRVATAPAEPKPAAEDTGPKKTPFERLMKAFQSGNAEPGPTNTVWAEAETEAYRDGPFVQAVLFRLVTWLMFLVIIIFGFGWTVIGAFCIGAALVKLDFFSPSRRSWHRRLFAIGLIAAPICLATAIVTGVTTDPVSHQQPLLVTIGATPVMMVAGLFLSFGYLSGLTLLATSGSGLLATPFAAAGRMALTNYLSQTLIATFVFYHWGLAQFESWPLPRRIGLVFAVYVAQLVVSMIWMKLFRFGPMEWLWRTITYRRLQSMRRTN